MSCHKEVHQITRQAFDANALDTALKQYGSEVYISAVVHIALHGSRFELINPLINYAAERIDWNNPPEPLIELLELIDHKGALKTGDPSACRNLCHSIAQINNLPYRVALLAVFAYYLQLAETSDEPHAHLAGKHLDD